MNVLFNLQGLWWPASISLHIDSKFVCVCGLVVFPDSQGISAGFMGFSPWCGCRVQIWAQPCWLHGSGHKWIILYRAWLRLTGLIERLISLCAACPQGCLLLTKQPPGSPWPFQAKHCCFLQADAAFKVIPSLACLAVGTRRDKYPRLCRIYLPISISKGYFQAL